MAEKLQQRDAARWPQRLAGLQRAELDHARRGYASSESEWESEIAAVGVGIEIGDGREPLALTVGGPAVRLRGALLHEEFAPALMATGRAIAAAIQAGNWQD
jgi:DNA-binding IclR family transcriptional regulator